MSTDTNHRSAQHSSGENIGLESTVDVFATRIARKLKEKDAQQSESEKAAEQRKSLILEAMTTIRRALQETLRINLGERFALELEIDDWDGWPRLQLNLVDSVAPNRFDYAMIVSAHDRKESGTIEITTIEGKILARVQLTSRAELIKLPMLLKRAVREFLEIVAAYVLNPLRPDQMIEVQSQAIAAEAILDRSDCKLKEANVFEEQMHHNDNLVATDQEISPVDLEIPHLIPEPT